MGFISTVGTGLDPEPFARESAHAGFVDCVRRIDGLGSELAPLLLLTEGHSSRMLVAPPN
jgi:hypothetical protein